jgi:multiple sugar transport system substrate-binding protein
MSFISCLSEKVQFFLIYKEDEQMNFTWKKIISLVMVTCLVGSMLIGCSQQVNNSSSSKSGVKNTTLTVALMCSDWINAEKLIVNTFQQKYPNIKIDFSSIPTTTCSEYLQPKAAAGTLPDFMSIDGGTFGAQLMETGMLVDLINTDSAKNESLGCKTVFTSKSGKLFGIAGGLSTTLIYYNKALFKSAGITQLPANWDEFLGVCQTLKSKNITPLGVACGDGTIGNTFWSYGFANDIISKDNNAEKELIGGTINFNTPENANIFNRLLTLYNDGYLINGVTSLQYAQANDAFMQGKVAMTFSGVWLAGTFMKSTFGTGVFLPPYNAASQQLIPVVGTETGYGIAKGKNEDAALKLLNYITLGDGYYMYQNARGDVPFETTTDMSRVMLDPAVSAIVKQLSTYPLSGPLYFEVLPTSITNSVSQYFQRVLTKSTTPAQAAAAMENDYQAFLKQS